MHVHLRSSACVLAVLTGLAAVSAEEPARSGRRLAEVPRMASRLRALAAEGAAARDSSTRDRDGEAFLDLVVRLGPSAAPADISRGLEAWGGSLRSRIPELRRAVVRLPLRRLLDLERSGLVEWVEDVPPEDLDRDENDRVREAMGYQDLPPFPLVLRGRGVLVGTWEAGHPDTETRFGSYSGHDDLAYRVRVMENSSPSHHATLVAGVLAGDGHASAIRGGQPSQWQGIAPRVQVLSWSTNDSDEEAAELLGGIREEGLHVSLQAWGESINRTRCQVFGDYTIRSAEFDQAIAGDDPRRAGDGRIPVVFSVGNYQNFLDCPIRGPGGGIVIVPGFWTINPPHSAKNIIAVGAVYSDTRTMTPFSSWGPTDDGRIKPDLVAPGAERAGDGGITSTAYDPPDGYQVDEGTSFSAAAVAGALAVLIGERMERDAPSLPPAAWKAVLVHSALDLEDDPGAPIEGPLEIPAGRRYRGPDYMHGFGLVSLPGALRVSLTPDGLMEAVVASGEDLRWRLEVPQGTSGLRLTLAWDDPPGDPAAGGALVNDIDLKLIEDYPGGIQRIHLPWVLDPQSPDLPATRGIDRLNNIEQVEVDGPVGGRLTLVVSGARVPRGPQRIWIALCEGCSVAPEGEPTFRRGDANMDARVNIADPILVFGYLFQGSELPCLDAADANDDGRLDIADSVRLLNFLFLEESGNLPPLGACQTDRTADGLGCGTSRDCP